MKRTITLAAAAVLALTAAGAAAAADKSPEPAKADQPARGNQCFWTRFADGFAAPDEHTLYVRVGVRDVYQFEMFATCLGLDWDQRIALISRSGGMICTGMDADIVTHETGIGRQRCAVRSVRKLTPEEIAALPRRAKP
jgi:hypothetical protein